ncbi:pyrroline-5-carboxylate reductase [bacterium]|nr:pyrroline-5-carboxylate reductase [bacterium]
MKKYKIGFIGTGKMASAIIYGIQQSSFVNSNEIIASQRTENTLEQKSQDLGIKLTTNNIELVKNSEIIFICAKPNQVEEIINEISPELDSNHLIVSIAAGITLEKLEKLLPKNSKAIRVMPNTPATIKEGMSGICKGNKATGTDLAYIESLFNTIGKTIIVDNDSQMDVVTAISGSGPAFYYKIINDIALAGEKLGLEYDKALLLSIQTAIGSAKMALLRDVTMEQLVANVATKGGCTRVGVDTMEELNIESSLFNTIKNTTQKAKELGG